MIRLERVSKHYGEVTAVREVDLEVEAGKLVVLIGPSGCGKTTTLKMINRLIEPSEGTIFVNGEDTRSLDPQALRRGIGYVIQSIGLFPHMSVKQNIQVVPDLLGWPKKRSAARADELLSLIGLPPERYRDAYPRELSGGQAQRVGVARALAVDPPVLLMDEPFGAVDPLTRERLQDEFLRLQAELRKTIVMVTHDIDEAIKLGDMVCVMNAGRVEQYSTPETLLSHPESRFVRQFVGSDRALKRLSRIHVGEMMTDIPSLAVNASSEEAERALKSHRTVYVTRDGRLAGWLDRKAFAHDRHVESAHTEVDAATSAVDTHDNAREALSKMLGQGVIEMPVVGEDGTLLGLVTLQTIVALTAERDGDGEEPRAGEGLSLSGGDRA